MKRARLLVHVGLALVGAAVVAAASMTLVRAFNPQPDPPGDAYSLIGLLRQETIEVTVSNYGVPNVGFGRYWTSVLTNGRELKDFLPMTSDCSRLHLDVCLSHKS